MTVVDDARRVIASPEIDIVVELIGGTGIAKALVLEAIAAGKHVVTANKALLAVHGTEISPRPAPRAWSSPSSRGGGRHPDHRRCAKA